MEVFFVVFLVFFNYFLFQSRTIFGGDSAEFLTVIATKSIAHPPGYPFYTLIGILFNKILFFLPYLERVNTISILSTSLACFLIYKILSLYKVNKTISLYTPLFFSSIYLVWLYSIVSEVFALHLFLITLVVYAGFKYNLTNKKNYLILFYLAFGLGLAHHHTIVIFTLPFILTNRKFIVREIIFIFIFLPIYLYPIFSSMNNPPLDWENSQTLIGLLRLFTRYSYGIISPYYQSIPDLINQLAILVSVVIYVLGDFKPISIFFIVIGLISIKRFTKKNYYVFSLTLFFYLIFLYLTNFNVNQSFSQATFERFLIPFYLILIFYFAFGIQQVYNWLMFYSSKFKREYLSRLSLIFFSIIILFLLINNYLLSYSIIQSLNKNDLYKKFVINLFTYLPKNSILLLKSDLTYFPSSYFYYVENYRNDVSLIFPGMFFRDYYLKKIQTVYPNIDFKNVTRVENFLLNNKKIDIFTEIAYSKFYFAPYGYLLKFYFAKDQLKSDFNKIIDFNLGFWKKNINGIFLDKNQQKILFLKALSEYQQEKLLQFFLFLKDNNKKDKLEQLKKIYQPYCHLFHSEIRIRLCFNP
jgi:hypothetical protein